MRVLTALFFMGVTVCAYSEQCPASEELKPCICDRGDHGSNNIKVRCFSFFSSAKVTLEDLKQAFKSLQGKSNVEMLLFDNELGKVPSNLFEGIGIVDLNIEYSPLESLADGDEPIFAGLEDSLEILRIRRSFKDNTDLSKLKFGHLKKLKDLTLYENRFTEVSNTWFENGPASLEIIDLLSAKIEKVGDRAFANLPNLKRLSLYGNRITSVERGMFPKPARNLKELYFSDNALESLPEDIFIDMPALSTLTIDGNDISTLDEKTWKHIWEQLNYVDVSVVNCDSSLEWMFDLPIPKYVSGYCNEVYDDLEDFIRKNRRM